MDISALNTLLPSTTSTNTNYEGANAIVDNSTFQSALNEATQSLENAKSIVTMTDEEKAQRDKDLMDASIQMESLFLKMIFDGMLKTVPKNELFGDDNAMEIYKDMYSEEMSKNWANSGGIGLADFIYKNLK